jgi:hypothetical protein
MGKYSRDKNIDKIVRELLVEGWSPTRKKGHWQLKPPMSDKIQTVPLTPSDGRAYLNFKSDIKRIKGGMKHEG